MNNPFFPWRQGQEGRWWWIDHRRSYRVLSTYRVVLVDQDMVLCRDVDTNRAFTIAWFVASAWFDGEWVAHDDDMPYEFPFELPPDPSWVIREAALLARASR